ncbi:MAG: hypothetical protein JW966_11450 [Anaerolineae bacterium]|nr:hypothetical protein [Anaerolineae bacterium]
MPESWFLEGPAGAGKTTYAIQYCHDLVRNDVSPEAILVMVPQRALGRPYQLAFTGSDWPNGTQIDIVTLGGLARRGLEMFWPLIADKAGFAHPEWEPAFLTIETSQYFMARFVNSAVKTGIFDSINVPPFRIMGQLLDNMSKAAVNGFLLDEVADRLITAWGDRHSSRPSVYRAGVDIAQHFREYCLQNNLLDFSLQIELFMNHLLSEPVYRNFFASRYGHLIADNIEEYFPVADDFIRDVWQELDSALLIYDTDGGYRVFLGADPGGMHVLRNLCDHIEIITETRVISPEAAALVSEFDHLLALNSLPPLLEVNPGEIITIASHKFYPDMIEWVVARIVELIAQGIPPGEIVILAPYLGDSLRFVLMSRLEEAGIAAVSHRPSRAVRDEPAARAALTLLALAHPAWEYHPPAADVADALHQVIDDLDPVRAWLLAQIVYRPGRDELGSFDGIRAGAQERITYRAGEKYERLREWLIRYRSEADEVPPDHFFSRLFGELLSQPGYGFHADFEAGRVVAQLVESARKFRRTLYPDGVDQWDAVTHEYFTLVQDGVLAALHVPSWQQQEEDAVFLAPAYTFLMRNRWVDYQFWLDVGSNQWWERLEQPLTHPYVLARNYPLDQVWTDDLEFRYRRDALRRLLMGLVRRCRKHIFMSITSLGEQGYEQRGPLLHLLQQIVQRYGDVQEAAE